MDIKKFLKKKKTDLLNGETINSLNGYLSYKNKQYILEFKNNTDNPNIIGTRYIYNDFLNAIKHLYHYSSLFSN